MPRPLLLLLVALLTLSHALRPSGPRAHGAEPPRDLGRVTWEDDAAGAGRRLAAQWPQIVADVEQQLGLSAPLEGAEVVVVRGLARLRERARADVPEWAAGVTVGGQRVVLRADAPDSTRASLEQTLRHEAVHLVWARRAGPRARALPRWFEEGLAERIGGGITVIAGARFEIAAAHDRLLRFEDLAHAFPADAERADLAYQQSQRFVAHLIEHAGWRSVRATLTALLEQEGPVEPSVALDAALRASTVQDLGAWIAAWRHSLLERRSRWWLWLFTDLGGVLLAVLAVLAAGLFAGLRRRRRRQIAALPDEPEPRTPAGPSGPEPGQASAPPP